MNTVSHGDGSDVDAASGVSQDKFIDSAVHAITYTSGTLTSLTGEQCRYSILFNLFAENYRGIFAKIKLLPHINWERQIANTFKK